MLSDTREIFSRAAGEAVTEDERFGLWPVFGYYRVREMGGDAIAVADRTVPKDVKPNKGPKSFDYKKRGGGRDRVRRYNVVDYYMPLADKEYANLFDKFAHLAERNEIDREVWLGWLYEHGTLGIRKPVLGRSSVGQQDATTDVFSRFVQEAQLASRTLRLFEAIADPEGLDVVVCRELLPEGYCKHMGDAPDELEQAALRMIRDTVEQKVHADCYPRFVPRDTGKLRKKGMSPFAREWGFDSLLGAMWLQFMWLATMDGIRYCKAPGCNRHIAPYARPDKITCDVRCRKRYERSRNKS